MAAKKDDTKDDEAVEVATDLDAEVATSLSLSEGEVHELREKGGLDAFAGGEGNNRLWEHTDDGKAFIASEGDRNAAAEAQAEAENASGGDPVAEAFGSK